MGTVTEASGLVTGKMKHNVARFVKVTGFFEGFPPSVQDFFLVYNMYL